MGGHDRGEGERWAERAREVLCTQITNVVADNDRLPIAFYPPILQRGPALRLDRIRAVAKPLSSISFAVSAANFQLV